MRLLILILWAGVSFAGEKSVVLEPSPIATDSSGIVLSLSALLVSYDVMSTIDMFQTDKAIRGKYFVEANPLLSGIVRDRTAFFLVKIGGMMLVNLTVKLLWNQSRTLAWCVAAFALIVQSYVTIHNDRVLR
jgi:hypothetical protein